MLRAALEWCRSTFLSLPFIVLGTAAATLLGLLVLGATQRPEAVEGIKRFWARWALACCFARLTVERRG
ncbi:MAG TPA: hypothetical protein VNN17_04610, partial [Terriglobia bacterium]|nr:hypothetical protein [Terriglobia bacterium]